jgi:hypothetical protein
MATLRGEVSGLTAGRDAASVLAVRGQQVVSGAPVGDDGRWMLELDDGADRLVVRFTGSRIGAVTVRPSEPRPVAPPASARVLLTLVGALPGAMLWVDPEALDGFPDELLWTLRAHPGDLVDLHVGEWTADTPTLELDLQRGRYRLAGGLIALRPWETRQALAEVVDPAGRVLVAEGSAGVVLSVEGDADYTVRFGGAT